MSPLLPALRSSWPDILGAIVVAAVTWYVTSSIYDGWAAKAELAHKAELAQQQQDFTDKVNAQQIKTEEYNRESNAKMADLERRAADARRLYQSSPCIAVDPATPRGGVAKGIQGGYVRQGNGIDAQALIDYFKLSEEIRESQDTCRRQADDIYGEARQ